MKSLILLAVLLAIVAPAIGRVFTRCELARELHYEHNFMRENLDDWVCLVEFESRFNTSAIYGPNTNGSFDWGLFQINDGWWCTVGSPGKDCNIDCNKLVDADITDDVACAKTIFSLRGFSAWNAWKSKCQDQLESTAQCFA